MFFYKNKPFFILPKEFATTDIEFNVYDSKGKCIGTNLLGILDDTYSEQEKYELEELVLDISLELEVNIKFSEEYGIKITDWKTLNKSKEKIINSMSSKWNISEEVISRYLI